MLAHWSYIFLTLTHQCKISHVVADECLCHQDIISHGIDLATFHNVLTHWGRVMYICTSKIHHNWSRWWLVAGILFVNLNLRNNLQCNLNWNSPSLIQENASLLIWTLGTNFSAILTETHPVSFKKMHRKKSCAKWWTFCFGLNVLMSS